MAVKSEKFSFLNPFKFFLKGFLFCIFSEILINIVNLFSDIKLKIEFSKMNFFSAKYYGIFDEIAAHF